MISELPIEVILLYTAFSVFQFYQSSHVKNFRGGSQAFLLALNISAFVATVFLYGYPLFYAYATEWYWALVLFAISFLLQAVWFALGDKNRDLTRDAFISIAGFASLPLLAYFLVNSLPA